MNFYDRYIGLTCQVKGFAELLEKYIGCTFDGVFVEIGAMNGETWSCCAGLADMGWEAHFVEPQRDQCIEIQMRHQLNKYTIDPIAIGREEGKITMYKAFGNACATTSDKDMREQLEENYEISSFIAPVATLDSYLQALLTSDAPETNSFGPGFELLSVDTEGTEHDVLYAFDVEKWRPKMIVVEMHQGHKDYQHLESCQRKQREVHKKLDPFYDVVYEDIVNTVFVWKEPL